MGNKEILTRKEVVNAFVDAFKNYKKVKVEKKKVVGLYDLYKYSTDKNKFIDATANYIIFRLNL